jgi:hypothetical protein
MLFVNRRSAAGRRGGYKGAGVPGKPAPAGRDTVAVRPGMEYPRRIPTNGAS